VAGTREHISADRRRISIFIDGEEKKSYFYGVGPSYLSTMGFEARQGQLFKSANADAESFSLVVNQTFVHQMAWDEPIGQAVRIESDDYTVTGVVDDFMLSTFSGTQEPVMFGVVPAASYRSLAVRANSASLAPVASSIQAIWESNFPEVDFTWYPQTQVFESQSMKGLSVFMGYVAAFALLISCMGLFGMAAQKAAQRQKEIGIRKSMGASAMHLLFVVNKEFLVMLLIATLIATPLCYASFAATFMQYAPPGMTQSWTPFIVANVLVFAVAMLSLSLQSRKLLKVVPAVVLRND